MKRIHSIDITRGIVMIIMALDHVRDLLHVDALTQQPTNLATTTPVLFFTRWITHLCAPTFVFLSGASAYLALQRSEDKQGSRRFLWKRGLYLVVLEFTIVNFGLFFDPGFHTLVFAVIATIGVGFIALSALSGWSPKTVGIIGLVIIFCHNLLPLIPFGQGSIVAAILNPFFGLGAFSVAGHTFVMGYPPVPWLGIMLVGFGAGKFFEWESGRRKGLFLKIGAASLALFILLRFINIYGDPVAWQSQKTALYTFFSFMNVTKYPPSLLFCLPTLGIMFLVLAWVENAQGKLSNIAITYGRVPLFYFVLHFYLIHIFVFLVLLSQGISWGQMEFATGSYGRPRSIKTGVSLWEVYLIWIAVVALLYKPCQWFGRYKATHNKWWVKHDKWWLKYM